jgi:AcrR family transcriptional regulator
MMSTVSPKTADPALRTALIEVAARLIAEEGSAGLSLRRLASEVGTSTMAIYTHFGSMDEVRGAVRREGFTRLAAHLTAVEETGDTVADLTMLGWAYYRNAVTNPNLYRAMFMEHPVAVSHVGVGIETFIQLVSGVDRCIRAGRFDPADPVELATQVWAVEHGIVALHLAGFLSAEQAFATFTATGGHLLKAFGDDAAALGRSLATARRRIGAPQSFAP